MPSLPKTPNRGLLSVLNPALLFFCLLLCCIACSVDKGTMLERRGQRFATAEEAVDSFKAAFRSEDPEALVAILGEEGRDIAMTGDVTSDRALMRRFSQQLERRAELVAVASQEYSNEQWYKLRYGIEAWNLRIPLINRGDGWYFAVHHASETARDIRMTLNQLSTISALLKMFDAQKNYMQKDCDKDGVHEYAQRIISTPGSCDGLYWEATPELGVSPLEHLVTKAKVDGYQVGAEGSRSYEGYVYKVLFAQGQKARGGSRSFLVGPNMTDGFAILAYPSEWNKSGANSLIIDSSAHMYKKDLGFRTKEIATAMTIHNPDATWILVDRRDYGEAANNPLVP